jgi:MFS family permease
MTGALESNIWKYTVLLVTNKRVFVAILSAYYLSIPGVTTFWIGIFMLAGNGAKFIFDIPSSYFADKIGHKQALVLSRISMIFSSVAFMFATNIVGLILGSILLSIGFAFISGVGSAFMHETFRALNRTDEYTTVMGKVSSIGFFIPALMMTVVPFTVSISYKIPFLIMIALDLLGLTMALMLVRPPVQPEQMAKVEGTRILEIVRQGFALRFFRIAIFTGIVSSLLDGIDVFRGPYQLFLGVSVIWFGIFYGTGRVGASIMLAYSGKIRAFLGDVYSYQRAQIIVYGTLLLLISTFPTPWVAVAVFIIDNTLQWGTSQVDTGYLLDIIRENKFKATLLSISNQLENVFSMVVVVVMGGAIGVFGYHNSFIVLTGVFFLILIPLHMYIIRNRLVLPNTYAKK